MGKLGKFSIMLANAIIKLIKCFNLRCMVKELLMYLTLKGQTIQFRNYLGKAAFLHTYHKLRKIKITYEGHSRRSTYDSGSPCESSRSDSAGRLANWPQ